MTAVPIMNLVLLIFKSYAFGNRTEGILLHTAPLNHK